MKHSMKALPWILCAALLGALVWQQFRRKPERHETVWDTIPIYDTITHDTVIPRDSIVLRYEVVNLPMVGNISRKNILENGNIALNNIPTDSARVVIPITQQHYKEDDFEAWVSGFRASLDSIRVFPKSYYLKPKVTKPKRLVISGGVNLGYNPFTRRFEPTLGVSVGWKLWEW